MLDARKTHAPAISYTAGQSNGLATVLCLIGLICALLPAVLWLTDAQRHPQPWATMVLLAVAVVSVWGLRRFWNTQTPRVLVWNGVAWCLRPGGRIDARRDTKVSLRLCLDLQAAVLVHCRVVHRDRAVWLWMQRHADADLQDDWHLLRCALKAHGSGMTQHEHPDRLKPGASV